MSYTLLGRRVLVRMDEISDKTEGGIIITTEQEPPTEGEIVAVGTHCEWLDQDAIGKRVGMTTPWGDGIKLDGVELRLAGEAEIALVYG